MAEQVSLSFAVRPRGFFTANGLRVEVDPARKAGSINTAYVGERSVNQHSDAQLVHVISPAAGGEIRGYVLIEHRLHLRIPCYSGEWPEMDMAVGDLLGALVVPYRVTAGGSVSEVSRG